MGIDALSPDERRQLVLSVGTHRRQRRLSPTEVAALFAKVINSGGTLSDCARATNLTTTWVGRFMRLLNLPATVLHLVDWGTGAGILGFTGAAELARLNEQSDKEEVVQAVLTNRLSGSEVRQIVQLRQRSQRPIGDCITEVVGMRPRVEKRFVYVGAVTLPELKEKLAKMNQQERDQLFPRALGEVLCGATVAVARLGYDRFTLVGGDDLGRVIATKRDLIEQELNERLLREAY